jgi:HEAT repeat protein/type 1 glutamine amidotransferase
VFAPESLAQFDAVCMLSSTGELFDDAKLKQSLVDFVKGGKGLVGIHAATDCFYKWTEYGDMMGGYFDGHPWGAGDTVTCKLDDPAHPLNAAFKGREFAIQDEIYQFQPKPYSREKLRVLVSLDTAKTNMDKEGLKREDGDYAIAWLHPYENGRVFYSSLGHNESTFWNAAVLQHFLDGIQFAIGDLNADAAPSASLTPEQIAQSVAAGAQLALDEGFKELTRYASGQDAAIPKRLSDEIIASHADAAKRADFEKRLVALLEANPTADARQFAVKHLRLIGSDACVPVLAALLANPATADDARYALEEIPGAAAGNALREALRAGGNGLEVGIINSLGERREPDSVAVVASYLKSSDLWVSSSAAAALGKIGGNDAEKALVTSVVTAKEERVGPYLDALLTAAETRIAKGEIERAAEIYEGLNAPGSPTRARVAAVLGFARCNSPKAVPAILRALTESDLVLQRSGSVAARAVATPEATREFADQLEKIPVSAQALLVAALADRGDASALPAITKAVASGDATVSLAAVVALGKIGNASSVVQLAELAGKGEKSLQPAAQTSLANLRSADVDAAIIAAMEKADNAVRRELVRALGTRRAKDAVPALLIAAKDPDEAVRAQAYTALGVLAPAELLRPIVELLAVEQSESARIEGEKAALAVLARNSDPVASVATVLSALPDVQQGIPAYCSILRVVGKINDPSAMDALLGAMEFKNADVRMTAARALSEWPTAAPMEHLLSLVQTASEAPLRDATLRGYLRMVELPDNVADLSPQYDAALKASRTAEERKLVLASIGKQHDPTLIDLVTPLLEDQEVKQEATLALEQLKKISYALSASQGAGDLAKAIDGDPATRWTTGEPQKPGQWLQIDMGYFAKVRKLTLDTTPSPGDYPREFAVYVSSDGKNWGDAVEKGKGEGPVTEIKISADRTRFIKIEQTGKVDGLFWSIHELKVEVE